MNKKIAVLLSCYNRKGNTLTCLTSLIEFSTIRFDVYLVDDGSTDGTSEAVHRGFPEVNVIEGSGSLFWNRGMHLAWGKASSTNDYDFYLWLNDDVILYENCFQELFKCSEDNAHRAIISGIVESEEKRVLYGGADQDKKIIVPNGAMQQIIYMNGNVVLIPRFVFRKLGNLDPVFHHDLGDVDYGLRAIGKGIGVYTTKVAVAKGTENSISRLRLNNSTLSKRFKRLYSPLGNPPSINFYFRRRHKGIINASIYWLFLHFLNTIPDNINKIIFKNKYQ